MDHVCERRGILGTVALLSLPIVAMYVKGGAFSGV
jgi:hypothetical protein